MNNQNPPRSVIIPVLILSFLLMSGLVIFILLRGNEDSWICKNGGWIKHGNPSSPKPVQKCEQNPAEDSDNSGAGNTEKDKIPLLPFGNSSKQDLSGKGLTQVPDSLIKNSSVTEIDISDNNIGSLPSQVEAWKNLVLFNIENNKVNTLPGEIRHWQKLNTLDASGNGMTNVPAEIGQLINLREIDFSDNQIAEFPNEILNLTGLEILDIRKNPVKPDHLQRLIDTLTTTTILR